MKIANLNWCYLGWRQPNGWMLNLYLFPIIYAVYLGIFLVKQIMNVGVLWNYLLIINIAILCSV